MRKTILTQDKLNILIIGNGAREHAYGWAINKSPRCGKLYFAPGNGGTRRLGENLSIGVLEVDKLLAFAKEHSIDLVIVGPEAPFEKSICDVFRMAGILIVGPSQHAAQLETSKAFAKTFMDDNGIPTAPFAIFDDPYRALAHVREQNRPLFVKASGLCGGKGAYPCQNADEASVVIKKLMLERALGDAGTTIVIESFLKGEEASVHIFTDGHASYRAPFTRDHKRLLEDGNFLPDGTNPNTGGMGAYGPVDLGAQTSVAIQERIISPTLTAMKRMGMPFSGINYPGVMLTKDGPMVLEYNARGGDPEIPVLMRLLKSDAIDLFVALAFGGLGHRPIEWHQDLFAVTVTLAAKGYPDNPQKGASISGLGLAGKLDGVVIFHAGTYFSEVDDVYYVSGGRVLSVSAVGDTLTQARERAYRAVDRINFAFDGMQYRRDIGVAATVPA